MTLTQFKNRFKLQVPGAKSNNISDSIIEDLINEGVNEVNLIGKVWKGYTDFDTVANLQIYAISDNAPTYLGTDERGLWWKNSAGKLQRVFPKTEKWLDKNIENWRDESSGDPTYYSIDGDDLLVYPKDDTATSNGFRLHHLKLATQMTSGSQYPWKGTTTEVTALRALDQAIVDYARWKISARLGKAAEGTITEKDFERSVLLGARRVKRRKDLTSDHEYGMKARIT